MKQINKASLLENDFAALKQENAELQVRLLMVDVWRHGAVPWSLKPVHPRWFAHTRLLDRRKRPIFFVQNW